MFQQKKLWVLENINLFLNLFKWGGAFVPNFGFLDKKFLGKMFSTVFSQSKI